MSIDEVLKEFRELLSQYTGEAITGHYNGETQQKMESLFFQAEARGIESERERILEEILQTETINRESCDWKSDLLTKLKEERGRATT